MQGENQRWHCREKEKSEHRGCLHPLARKIAVYVDFFDRKIKKYGSLLYHRLPSFVVEMRGVEPLSENLSTQLSTGVFPALISRCRRPGTNSGSGSHFVHDRFNGELPVHGHHFMTLTPGSWSSPANGRRLSAAARLTPPVQQNRCRLIF